MNNHFRPSKRALVVGGITTVMFCMLFVHTELIVMDIDMITQFDLLVLNTVSFVFSWLMLSLLMTRYTIKGVLYVLSILVLAGLADYHLPVSKNPVTIPMIIVFWLGVGYLIQPQFFRKFRILIFAAFGMVISYYFYHFLTTSDYGPSDRGSFANFMLLPIPAFIALWGYEQWRWLKTLQSDKASAELALLKSQINPHFFFNTLNNLYGLVVENSDHAPDVVLKLSDMMRYTIYEGKKELVSLQAEIDYLETYIDLHKIRHQKEVNIQFNHKVDGSLQVAPLLFIILLENAFKHGVEKVRKDAFIHIHLHSEKKQISFEIKNRRSRSAANEVGGIGLDNLRQRLEHLYPNHHELIIEENESAYAAQLNITII